MAIIRKFSGVGQDLCKSMCGRGDAKNVLYTCYACRDTWVTCVQFSMLHCKLVYGTESVKPGAVL